MKRNLLYACTLAAFLLGGNCEAVQAQDVHDTPTEKKASLGGILGNIVGNIVEQTKKVDQQMLVGTWTFEHAACEFESENFLKQAGGNLAATTIEKKLDELYSKIGVKKDVSSYTFNEDGTYSMNVGLNKSRGTYTFDEENGVITLKGLLGKENVIHVSKNGKEGLTFLYSADKLLELVNTIGSKVNIKAVQSLSSLLGSYDGLKLGMDVNKKS